MAAWSDHDEVARPAAKATHLRRVPVRGAHPHASEPVRLTRAETMWDDAQAGDEWIAWREVRWGLAGTDARQGWSDEDRAA